MSLSSPGVGSGLDVKSIVDVLVKAEITPAQNRLNRQQMRAQTELSAIGQLKSGLSSFKDVITKLMDSSNFSKLAIKQNTNDYLSATLGENASIGSYQIEVRELASQQSLSSQTFANSSATLGTGTIQIDFGRYNADLTTFTQNNDINSLNLTIDTGEDSLESIRNKINESDANVTASIISDEQGSRLTLTSKTTGENFAMRISVTGAPGLNALAYDPTNGITDMTESVEAKNSIVRINGIELSNSSNTLKDNISGISIDLKKAEIGQMTTLTVSENKDATKNTIKDFVKRYNELQNYLYNLVGFDQESKRGGPLQGDAALNGLKGSFTRSVTEALGFDNGNINGLADLGIKVDKKGILEIDEAKLTQAIDENYDAVARFFAGDDDNKMAFGKKLDTLVSNYIGIDGSVSQRNTQLEAKMRQFTDQQEQINRRAQQVEARYLKQFTALDLMISELQSTSQFLTNQLANLPQMTIRNRG